MSAPTKQRGRIHRHRGQRCPDNAHEFPRPLSGRRPCIVFCSRCQQAKDAT